MTFYATCLEEITFLSGARGNVQNWVSEFISLSSASISNAVAEHSAFCTGHMQPAVNVIQPSSLLFAVHF